jgi:hypothetical protein
MAYYGRTDEDKAQNAISVVGSAEDTGYRAVNIISSNPAQPAKLTTTSGTIVLGFAAKIAPRWLALIYHYLDAGLEVFIEANNTNVWTSPSFSQALTIPVKRKDGPSYQRWTNNVLQELELPDADGYFYWRLNITGTNSQAIAIGRMLFYEADDLVPVDILHVSGDFQETDNRPDRSERLEDFTELGVRLVTTIGGPQRGVTGWFVASDVNAGTAPVQEAGDFRALYEATDRGAGLFLFIPQLRDDEPWLVYFEAFDRAHAQGGYQVWTFSLREASRGVPWP